MSTEPEIKFFFVMFCFGGIMGILTLIYVLRRAMQRQRSEIGGWELRGAGSRIRAVARTTIAEGMRAKVASGFALLMLVSIPFFYFTAEGDGTIKGRVQMFMSYSMGFSAFVLSLLTIFFACRSLSVEISSRQIYSIVTKPIPRWQIVVGKWVGVMTLNAVLLSAAGLATYIGTRTIVGRFKADLEHDLATKGGMTPEQADQSIAALDNVHGIGKEGASSPIVAAVAEALGKSVQQVVDIMLRLPESTRNNLRRFDEVRRQVLVGRAGVPVRVPDMTKDIDDRYNQIKNDRRLPEGMTQRQIKDQIKLAMENAYCTIAPGEARKFTLKGPIPQKNEKFIMSVRFKIRVLGAPPQAREFMGSTLDADTSLCLWGIGDPSKPNFGETADTYPINTFYELEIPSESIEPDGTIIILLRNIDPRQHSIIFDFNARDLEVLYRVASFEMNLVQVWFAIMIPLACLACFGVCASTFLTFPVGVLICLAIYLIAGSLGFIAESLAATPEYIDPTQRPPLSYEIRRVVIDGLDYALALGETDPVNKMIEGRSVGWPTLAEQTWKFVLMKGAIIMGLAVLILRRRELAAVIV
jgi:hypothetical protein